MRAAVGLLLLAAASLPWIGYRIGGSNQSIQIPILKHYADPSLYANDLLLQSLPGYATYFFPAMAPLVRAAGEVERPYFVVYFLGHLATLAALYALSRHLFGDGASAALTCLLYLTNPLSLAGESSLASRLQHGHAATPLLLFALLLHLRGRLSAALALAGAAFNVHALYAAYVAAMIGTDVLLRRRRAGLRPLLAGGALFAALALPSLLWILGGGEPIPPESAARWVEMLEERSGLHTFPLSQPAAPYASYLLLAALAALGLAADEARGHRAGLLGLLAGVGALAVAGLAFSEWLPVPIVLKAQLLRATKWATYLFLLALARLLVLSWSWGGVARAAALLCGVGLLAAQPALLGAALAAYLLSGPGRWPAALVALGGSALVAAAASGALSLPEGLGVSEAGVRLGRALGDPRIAACLGFFLLLRAAEGRRWARAAAAGAIAGVALYVLPSVERESREAAASQSWNEVQIWVRDHTPRDAVILTPPYREGFRVFSERAIVGEWKDGTQQFFGARFAFAWRERMEAVQGWTQAYDDFDTAKLVEIARRYGADYVVTRARARPDLPRLFHNSVAAVYRVDAAR